MIDHIVSEFGGPMESTVDTVKVGDTLQPVRGVVTTFMATVPVIRRAVQLGANLIFTHEPTFFNHADDVASLQADPVYRAKLRLLEETGIVVFRLHDYPHGLARANIENFLRGDVSDDPFSMAMVEAMGWQAYADPRGPTRCIIPPVTLAELIRYVKERLRVKTVRVTGDPEQVCNKVLLWFGGANIQFHVPSLERFDADVIVTGECPEWETFAYAYDANELGIKRALIAVGHEPSEEPGMERLAVWLRERFPGLAITHVPAANPVAYY
jgi:putative NIF3 family GTP cyclohydrolase 1 type 2